MNTFKTTCLSATLFCLISSAANAAGSSANVTSYIIRALSVKKISDLNFGVGIPGDGPRTIVPQTIDTAENASFNVSGEPGMNFSLSFPAGDRVTIINGAGGTPQSEIIVSNFKTNLAGNTAKLDVNGQYKLFVGATRSSIRADQNPGQYIGTFQIDVIY